MPSDERRGVVPYYWEMEKGLREALDKRCEITGRNLKEELTEAVLHWLEREPDLSAKARAARLAGTSDPEPKKGKRK